MREEALSNLAILMANDYPGRMIIVGVDPSGNYLVQAYGITARSEPSQNRRLEWDSTTGRVYTVVADPSKDAGDTAITLYNAMYEMREDELYLVSNGRHTDAMMVGLAQGANLLDALEGEKYENDPHIYTSRIAAVSYSLDGKPRIEMASLRKSPFGEGCDRFVCRFGAVPSGYGYCLTTYSGDGILPPAMCEEPYLIPLNVMGVSETAEWLWGILNPKIRVSLVVKYIEIATGESTVHIINKHLKL